jgi:hypothetical protein
VGVKRGVGVIDGVGVGGVMVSVGIMATGVVTAATDGRGVVVSDVMADGVKVGPGDRVTEGMVVGSNVASGLGVSVLETGFDSAAAGTDGSAARVGVSVTVGLSVVGVVPTTVVDAGALPQAVKVFNSAMTSMSAAVQGVLALLLRCRP